MRLQIVSWRHLEEEVLKTRQKASCKHVLKTTWKMKNCYTDDVFETSSRRIGKREMFHGQMLVVFIQFSAQERLIFLKKRLVSLLRIFKNNFEIFNMCCFRKHFWEVQVLLGGSFPSWTSIVSFDSNYKIKSV